MSGQPVNSSNPKRFKFLDSYQLFIVGGGNSVGSIGNLLLPEIARIFSARRALLTFDRIARLPFNVPYQSSKKTEFSDHDVSIPLRILTSSMLPSCLGRIALLFTLLHYCLY